MIDEITHTPWVQLTLPALVALSMVFWIFFRILKIAKDKNVVDNPDARKLQSEPVPVMGGIAVFFGVMSALLVGCILMDCSVLLPVICAMVVMLYMGAMDDVIGMTPKSRLIAEMLVVTGIIYGSGQCIDSLHGLWGIESVSWWIAVPLTVFACTGVINAINMIDGVNGLNSGLCLTCSALFGAVMVKRGDMVNAMLAFATAAALFPFLLHNVFGKRSRMFIGDAGTMIMGTVMTWFMISLLSSEANRVDEQFGVVALAIAVLAVPVFDTLRVMALRILRGQSIFQADKTHLHHAFIAVGVSHSITALSEILLNLAVVGIWYTAYRCGASVDVQFYVAVAAALVLVWGAYALLWYGAQDNAFGRKLQSKTPRTHLGHTKRWLRFEKWLDAPEDRLAKRYELTKEKKH